MINKENLMVLQCPLCNNCKSSFEKPDEIFFAYHKCPITNYKHSVKYQSKYGYYNSVRIIIMINHNDNDKNNDKNNLIILNYNFSYLDKRDCFTIDYKSLHLFKRGEDFNFDFSINDIVDYTKTMNCFL